MAQRGFERLGQAEPGVDQRDHHPQQPGGDDHRLGFAQLCRLLGDDQRVSRREDRERGNTGPMAGQVGQLLGNRHGLQARRNPLRFNRNRE